MSPMWSFINFMPLGTVFGPSFQNGTYGTLIGPLGDSSEKPRQPSFSVSKASWQLWRVRSSFASSKGKPSTCGRSAEYLVALPPRLSKDSHFQVAPNTT